MMNRNHFMTLSFAVLLLIQLTLTAQATPNIDPANQFAWSENIGWLNFASGNNGVEVTPTHLSGFVWGENIGWIKLGADAGGPYVNSSASDWGVNRAASGVLSGFGWSENTGWVNFDQVTIAPLSGEFDGYAWAENVGWIHLRSESPAYGVATLFRVLIDTTAQTIPTLSGVGLAVLIVLLVVLLNRQRSSRMDQNSPRKRTV